MQDYKEEWFKIAPQWQERLKKAYTENWSKLGNFKFLLYRFHLMLEVKIKLNVKKKHVWTIYNEI